MANEEHVRVVKQGAGAIHAWRALHPGVQGGEPSDWEPVHRPDLISLDPSCADVDSANLRYSRLQLRGADLAGANLIGADLRGADLREASLHGANLTGADLREANLSHADLSGAGLHTATLLRAILIGANLHGAHLGSADLRGAVLNFVDLRGANLRGAKLLGASLRGVDMRLVNLVGVNLDGVDRDDVVDLSDFDLEDAAAPDPARDRMSEPLARPPRPEPPARPPRSETLVLPSTAATEGRARTSWSTLRNAVKNLVKFVVKRKAADPVLLGASAPRAGRPGGEFTARFVAYVKSAETDVQRTLKGLAPSAEHHMGTQICRWRQGTSITIRLSGKHLKVKPAEAVFVWSGERNLVEFDVCVDGQAPLGITVLKYDVLIEEITVARLRVDLRIAAEPDGSEQAAIAEPARTAFASYATQDRLRVLDRLASVRASTDLDVFLDCLSLNPGERWKLRVQREIENRDLFLLFWSSNARESQWVEWEWKTALAQRGLDVVQPHPLEPVHKAPPPPELSSLHFGDPLMLMRAALGEHRDRTK